MDATRRHILTDAPCLPYPSAICLFGHLYQIPDNLVRKNFVDFTVSWDRLGFLITWIVVNIMLAAMKDQYTTRLTMFLNQFLAFHAISKSSSFLIPGIESALKV